MAPRRPHVVMVGSTIFDLVVSADRIPREGEVVLCTNLRFFPGGKGANRAVAAARLGARVTLISAVGGDRIGDLLIRGLDAAGIDTARVERVAGQSSGCSWVAVLPSGNNATFVDPAANFSLGPALIASARDVIAEADALCCDLEIPLETVEAALSLARQSGKLAILDAGPPRQCPMDILRLADIVSPNEPETEALTGQTVSDPAAALKAANRLVEAGVKTVILKLGSEGAMLVTAERAERFPAPVVHAVDPTGAGDAFTTALVVELASGALLDDAIRCANLAGALAVTRPGAQPSLPTAEEIRAFAEALASNPATVEDERSEPPTQSHRVGPFPVS